MDNFVFMDFWWSLGLFLLSALCILALIMNVTAKASFMVWSAYAMAASLLIGLISGVMVFTKGLGSEQPKLAQAIKADDQQPGWLTSFQCLSSGLCRGTVRLEGGTYVPLRSKSLRRENLGSFHYHVKDGNPNITVHWDLGLIEMPLAAFMVRRLADEYVETVVKSDPRFHIEENGKLSLNSAIGALSETEAFKKERQRIADTYK